MKKMQQRLIKWIKAHKKQLIAAGLSIAVLVGTVMGIKNRASIVKLWHDLRNAVKASDIIKVTPIPVAETVQEVLIVPVQTHQLEPFEVCKHIRNLSSGREASELKKARKLANNNYTAYLKISDGCDNRCAYCAIPLIRGEFVSREPEKIIYEANRLAECGYKELIVLQQDTTKYGVDFDDKSINIVFLLKELLKVKSLDYIRLLYLYPDEISEELIDLISKEPRLTPYFDIPIQHSEDKILELMNRRGNKNYLRNLFKRIREKCPNAVLRTTVMVGFPGETEDDFKGLLDFIQEIEFDHLGCFSYSREEDTPAYNFPNQLDEEIKKKRLDEVMRLQQKISYRKNKLHIGEVMEGLVVGTDHDYYCLRSYWNAPDDVDGKILFKCDSKIEIGQKIKVKITSAFVYDLLGEAIL